MGIMKRCCLLLPPAVICLWLSLLGAQTKPQVTVSPARAKSGEPVYVAATGFTPNRTAMSHLVRPDGTEYNPLRFRTNDRGEFFHKIDTTMLDLGTFQIWVEDEASNVSSNRAQFTVDFQ
jgi:hypothetical protein